MGQRSNGCAWLNGSVARPIAPEATNSRPSRRQETAGVGAAPGELTRPISADGRSISNLRRNLWPSCRRRPVWVRQTVGVQVDRLDHLVLTVADVATTI